MALEGRHEQLEELISKIKDPAVREAFQEMKKVHQEEVTELKGKIHEMEQSFEAIPEKKTIKETVQEKAASATKKTGELYSAIKNSEKAQKINSRIDQFKEKSAELKNQVEKLGVKMKDSSVYVGRAMANASEKTKSVVSKGIQHTSQKFKDMVKKVQTVVNHVKENVKQKQDVLDTNVKAAKTVTKEAVQVASAKTAEKTGALYDEIRKKPAMLELRDRMNKFKAKAISMGRSLKKAGVKVAEAAAYTGRALASTPEKTKAKVQEMVNTSNEKFKDAVQKTEEIAQRVKDNYQVAQKNIAAQKQLDRQQQKDKTLSK